MKLPKTPVPYEGFETDMSRKKRLGQYFTGTGLARLLASLAKAQDAKSIIDPMAGSGDMLVACLEIGARPEKLGAVEIDHIAHGRCSERVPHSHPILGNAFDSKNLEILNNETWDLVITNPPYVRYQSLSNDSGDVFHLPSAIDIRRGLIDVLENLSTLDDDDKRLFKELASAYSGLSDLAVPSWILCAALCASNGRIALVLPESWLSRNYALVIQYLLLRWFKIEFLVEDAHAAWFSDSQVKTTLIVAKRILRKDSAFNWTNDDTFLRLRISGQAMGAYGVVDNMYPTAHNPEMYFVEQAKDWLLSKHNEYLPMIEVEHISLSTISANLYRSCRKQKWLERLESIQYEKGEQDSYVIPTSLASWLSSVGGSPSFKSLESFGVHVGQGLRTGANDFFYAEVAADFETETEIISSIALGRMKATVPKDMALPALRRQSDLPNGYVVKAKNLKNRVLVIKSHALPEDSSKGGEITRTAYSEVPKQFAKWIKEAESLDFGKGGVPRRISELSAVAPNIRKGDSIKGIPPRFWYMLPNFTSRHKPDLLVARVNSGTPRTYLNKNRDAIIDANFSTIWSEEDPDTWALLALLNSSWCMAAIELSASVMGGGALKVEATHLRRLPIPDLDYESWKNLEKAGRALNDCDVETSTLDHIDKIVLSTLLGRCPNDVEIASLRQIIEEGLHRRKSHRKSKRKS